MARLVPVTVGEVSKVNERYVVRELEGWPITEEARRYGRSYGNQRGPGLGVQVLDSWDRWQLVAEFSTEIHGRGKSRKKAREIVREKARKLADQRNAAECQAHTS